jgi:hypothetical protein
MHFQHIENQTNKTPSLAYVQYMYSICTVFVRF